MTTDPTPDLCCTHGQQLDTLAAELARANQLLADLVEIRRGKNTQQCPTPEEVVEFARGGIVKAPAGHVPPVITRGCDYVISPDEFQRWTADTLSDDQKQEFQRIVLNRVVKSREPDGYTEDGRPYWM